MTKGGFFKIKKERVSDLTMYINICQRLGKKRKKKEKSLTKLTSPWLLWMN